MHNIQRYDWQECVKCGENGQFSKSGAWAEADESVIEESKTLGIDCPAKFHGEQAILTFLEENPKFVEHWYNRFKDALS